MNGRRTIREVEDAGSCDLHEEELVRSLVFPNPAACQFFVVSTSSWSLHADTVVGCRRKFKPNVY